jgi:hypothetical protein
MASRTQVADHLYGDEAARRSDEAGADVLPFGWAALVIVGLSLLGWGIIVTPFLLF